MAQSNKRSNFLEALAGNYVSHNFTKPFFGSPFIKYADLISLACHSFHVGGALGCHFRGQAHHFITVFLSTSDPTLTVNGLMSEISDHVTSLIIPGCSTWDYMVDYEMHEHGFTGDRAAFLLKIAGIKVGTKEAAWKLQTTAIDGVAMGLSAPDRVRELYENMCLLNKRSRSRIAGVNIPKLIEYTQHAADSIEIFSHFCRETYPDVAPILGL